MQQVGIGSGGISYTAARAAFALLTELEMAAWETAAGALTLVILSVAQIDVGRTLPHLVRGFFWRDRSSPSPWPFPMRGEGGNWPLTLTFPTRVEGARCVVGGYYRSLVGKTAADVASRIH